MCCLSPAPPRDNHEKSSDLEPISQAPKVMKTDPKATKNIKKWHWNQQNPDICDKLVFAHLLKPNACFPSSIRPDSYQKVIKKEPGKKYETKTPVLLQSTRKANKIASQNTPKINKNPTLDPRMSFLLLLWPPRAPPRCQSGPPVYQNGATKPANW